MDQKHKELLKLHRTKFIQSVEVNKLYPSLQNSKAPILEQHDITEINLQPTETARVEKLLDILPGKGFQAFQALCMALENTYPHLLTAMFLGRNQASVTTLTDSLSTSLTSDSEEDSIQNSPREMEDDDNNCPNVPTTYTRHIPVHEYDLTPQNTMSTLHAELSSTNPRDREEHHKIHPKMESYKIPMRVDNRKHSYRDYDRLKEHFEDAMRQLQDLNQKYKDAMEKCDKAVRDANRYRKRLEQLEHGDLHAIRAQLSESISEKKRLEQEVHELQKLRDEDKQEMAELLQHQRQAINESGSNEVLNKMYDTALDKYEATRKECDLIRKRYADLNVKLEVVQEKNEQLVKKNEELAREHGLLQQHCRGVIHQCSEMSREKQTLKDELEKEHKQLLQFQSIEHDLRRVKDERNAAVSEYKVIMSERDAVLKEIDQLQDRLTEMMIKNQTSDNEKKTIQKELDRVRRELVSVLTDRDHAVKEINNLRDFYGDAINAREDIQKERDEFCNDFEMLIQERDTARRERLEALEQRDRILYEKSQQEKAGENKDYVTEIETLKKEIEKLQQELSDALRETNESKAQREWAFKERETTLMERDSWRKACDNLRQERDLKVNELTEALRDSDELKRLKNEATKELKDYKDKYEALIEKENRKQQLNHVGHNHSRDSAIDADLQEWETETLQFDLGGRTEDDLGFELVGGKDDPQFPNDYSIFVSNISKGSVADNKLKVNDQLLTINNVDVTNVDKEIALQAVKNTNGVLNMVVRRRKSSARATHAIQLNLSGDQDAGIIVENGLYISKLLQGSAAAKEANLAVGDRVLSINGRVVENKNHKEGMKMIEDSGEHVILQVSKFLPSSSSPAPQINGSFNDSGSANLIEGIADENPGSRAPLRARPWANEMDSSKSCFKAMVSSGSQTDTSVDSPGLAPRKKQGKKQDAMHLEQKSRYEVFLDKIKLFSGFGTGKSQHKIREGNSNHKSANEIMTKSDTQNSISEQAVLNELNNVIDPHYSQGDQQDGSQKEKAREELGSTWPRYRRPESDYSNVGTVVAVQSKKKSRPGIPQFTVENKNVTDYKSPSTYSRVPPAPPERTGSSFAASIRHSPQNSDISNKFSVYSPSGQQTSTSNSNYVSSSSTNKQSPSSGLSTPSTSYNSFHKTNSTNSSLNYEHRSHHSAASTPDPTLDLSVVSQRDMDIVKQYYARPNPKRHGPRRHHVNQRASTPSAQKPTYLDLEPSYNVNNHAQGHTGYGGYPENRFNRDGNKPFQSPGQRMNHVRSPGSRYTPSGSTQQHSQVRVNQAASNYQARSQPVSPSDRAPAVNRHSPNGTGSFSRGNSIQSSIPEMDTDSTPYYLHSKEGQFQVAPSPSFPSNSTLDRTTPTPSEDIVFSQVQPQPERRSYQSHYHMDGTATIPHRKSGSHHNERIHISSLTRLSNNSVDRVSDSPMSPFGAGEYSSSNSIPKTVPKPLRRKPKIGETRNITIEKREETDQLGLQIQAGGHGGIFVSSVVEGSWAEAHGLVVGDQLLEVCGINMRAANYTLAASVLRQCGETVTMLVQYNPNKLDGGDPSSGSAPSNIGYTSGGNDGLSRLASITPTNSPRKSISSYQDPYVHKPRFVFLKKTTSNLGVSLIGGNAVGIFVNELDPDSPACSADGLRRGDQILEINGMDLRSATAEQAMLELTKLSEMSNEAVSVLAQYNMAKYNKIQNLPGDSFFVRAMFDRHADNDEELSFHKDDILYVENTLYEGKLGVWQAWKIDDDGNKTERGSVPSKTRLEDEAVTIRRSISETLQDDDLNKSSSRRLLASARRSSFFRKRKHQRNNSKDSREFTSFSDMSINSDTLPILDDGAVVTYQKVDKFHDVLARPILIIGPLAEPLIKKLTSESPDKYVRCNPDLKEDNLNVVEKKQGEGIIIDYSQQESYYECLTASAIKEIMEKNRHCMLSVTPNAIERLHKLRIYPIVLFIKYKSPKQIRDVKDTFFLPERVSTKQARDLYDTYQKVETDYKNQFSVVLQGGNLAFMCRHIKSSIDIEQKKMVWVPSGTI